ncbi:hypothetical protein BH23GEM5_BH23GEM5_04820 [soil metagenome]
MNLRSFFAALLFAVALPQSSHALGPKPVPTLQRELQALVNGAGSGRYGMLVVSLDRGDTLFALGADRPLAPASNMKLFTTAAALLLLGPEFRYSTYLLADGEVRDGVLEGDLILYGTGDPTLSGRLLPSAASAFEAMADSLRAAGIREVRGSLVGDGSFFDAEWTGPEWTASHRAAAYGAPVGALAYAENLAGGRPVSDPLRYTVAAFRETLARRGIRVVGGTRTVTQPAVSRVGFAGAQRNAPPRPLAVHLSPPLRDIIRVTNQVSHNGFAEALLKTVGRVASGTGSFAEGCRATRVVLAQTLGLDTARLGVTDGSGLSRSNRVTAGTTVQLLTAMARSNLAPVWEESLPVASGGAGSLRNRMGGTSAAGNLRAKTGTIRSVSSLSGYVRTADGERLAFSIVANDLPDEARAKRLEDQIGARLARFRR